jgi:broad specificity phosphatase PhoE
VTARLLLIRHGESVLGAQNRYAGRLDPPLTQEGRRQVEGLRRRFLRFRVDYVFTSDLLRCRETVELLAPRSDVACTKRLREIDFGAWEGLTPSECLRMSPSVYRRWIEDPRSVAPPGGEPMVRFARRVLSFADRVAARFLGRTVAIVTHGGAIRVLLDPGLRDLAYLHVPPADMIVRHWRGAREAAP